jgi:hypothetical protein
MPARGVGAGWDGFGGTVALGPLPASLSHGACGALPWLDWLGTGIDPTTAYAVNGAIVAFAGPDTSLFSARERPAVDGDGAEQDDIAARLHQTPLAPDRYIPPAADLSMRTGDLVESWAGRFGRSAADSTRALEVTGGSLRADAPLGLGRAERTLFGARLAMDTPGGWTARVRGERVDADRTVTNAGLHPDVVRSVRSAGAAEVRLERGATAVAVFAGTRRMEDHRGSEQRRGELRVSTASVSVGGGPLHVDAVRVSAGHVAASGSLFRYGESLWSADVTATRTATLARGRLALTAGATRRRGTTLPHAHAEWRRSVGRARLCVVADAVSRDPSSLERLLAPLELPSEGRAAVVSGSPGLDAEGAVSLGASVEFPGFLSGAGASVSAARLRDPVIISADDGELRNGDDETTAGAALWVEGGDRAARGFRFDASLLVSEDESALTSHMPAPQIEASATAWVHASFFRREYLRTRWSARVVHERGRARGPWNGLVDDAFTTLDLSVEGTAGSVVVRAALLDAFDSERARAPLRDPGGRRLEAGFRWHFEG